MARLRVFLALAGLLLVAGPALAQSERLEGEMQRALLGAAGPAPGAPVYLHSWRHPTHAYSPPSHAGRLSH